MLRLLALTLFFCSAAFAAQPGPIRVLYLDPTGAEQTQVGPLADAMRELGRDAIWFDYLPGPAKPTDTFLSNAIGADLAHNYDVVRARGDALSRESILGALNPEHSASRRYERRIRMWRTMRNVPNR